MKGYRTYQILAVAGLIALLGLVGLLDIDGIAETVTEIEGLVKSLGSLYIAYLAASKVISPAPMKHENKNV